MTQGEHNSKTKEHNKDKRDGILQIALVVGVLIVGLIVNRILSNNANVPPLKAAGAPSILVKVIEPTVTDVQLKINETGTVQVRNAIELSPQVSGRVVYVNPSLASGGAFSAGEVLFRVDDSDYLANVERAQADLLAREADLRVENAEADVAIKEWELINPNQTVPPNVAREPQLERARAAVSSAEALLADARLDLARVSFFLPFDGRVLTSTIELGQNLMAGQAYGRAYDPSDIEISVPIQANFLRALSPVVGRKALVKQSQNRLNPSDSSYLATVIREDAELDSLTRLARLTLSFDHAVNILPGEFVDVEIIGPSLQNVMQFQESTLQENRSIWVVDNGQLSKRFPEIIYGHDGEIITQQFDIADGIVTSPLNNPKPGLLVEIAKTTNDEVRP